MATTLAALHQCSTCGHRFKPWHKRAANICRPCGELAFEIERIAGPQFVTRKAIMSARARQLLSKSVLNTFQSNRFESGQPANPPPVVPASQE